jgi:hypothetical protein
VYLKESLETAFAIGDRLSATVSIEQLGNIAAAQNNTTRAAKLFAAAVTARSSLNTPLTPASQDEYAAKLESIRQNDPIAFETAWATGQTWNLEQAAQFGLVLESELVKKF